MKLLIVVLAALGLARTAIAAEPAPIEVMFVGTYHFDNPGMDLNNVKAVDVLTPQRQRELAAVATELARFKPTKVAIERAATTPELTDPLYPAFTLADLTTRRDERVQIGYRLAKLLGHPAVYAIDEVSGPNGPDYFPYDKLHAYAEAHGRGAELASLNAPIEAATKAFEAKQNTASMGKLLAEYNDPQGAEKATDTIYYAVLRFGDVAEQPGADLNGAWFLRNAKIFSKLLSVAKPGDRVVIVYGRGHSYWLRHFASQTPGVKLVEALPYLRAAGAKR